MKASPAVIAAVLCISLFVPISTAAATETASPMRLSGFEQRTEKLQQKLDRLKRTSDRAKSSSRLRHKVLKANALVKRMNRSLARLGDAMLSATDVDDAFVAEVLACNAVATRLDKDAIRLSRRTLKRSRSREVKALSQLRTELISISVQLRKPKKPSTPMPTPMATQTASPEPTASAVPAPTSTPAATATPTVTPTSTYTTMSNARLTSGTASAPRVYERIIFTGGSSVTGVLHINYTLHDVVIRDCVIESGPQNGLTINALDNAIISNVRFEDVVVRPQPRMGVEVTDRTSSGRTQNNWHHLTFDGVRIEPQGSEAFSLCSAMTGDTATTVKDMVIEGSGNRPDLYSWGQGFEINKARGVTVDGLTIRQTRGSAFNLQGPTSSTDMLWRFTRVNADMSVSDSQQTQPMASASQVVYCKNATGWSFSGRVVGTTSDCGYLDNVKNADFTGTSWSRVGGTARVLLANGSSGCVALP